MGFQHDNDEPEPPQLRRLRWLVSGLMVVLIVAVLAIAATIVIRFGLGLGGTRSLAADQITLPAAMEVVAIGRGDGTILFVLRGPDGAETLRAYNDRTGEPAGASAIARQPPNG